MQIISAAKAIIVVDGEALVLRNSETHPRWAFWNDLPGGTVEKDEQIEDALIREIHEETSIKLPNNLAQLIYTSTEEKTNLIIHHLVYVAFLKDKPRITLSFEHDQHSWEPVGGISGFEPKYQQGIEFAQRHKLLISA